jgi:hypothetical protein
MNNNQQMRFLTLLHDPHVLKQGEIATDPARTLRISVVNDNVVSRPLVCRVRVEWAQGIADDPNGAFDLRVEPWDSNYQTPDVWVDRVPFGTFDQPKDASGRPGGNGDKPRPNETNHIWGRVHCDGTVPAQNVRVTFYAVEPPGVGDNGNWAPIQTKVIANVANGSFEDLNVNWVPVVGRHTCLQVFAEQQLGEITGGNNRAQENVFQFEAVAKSVPAPVIMPVAVRNPLKQRTVIFIAVKGVPDGFKVQFPHSWIWLDPLEERRFELAIVPTRDYGRYRDSQPPHAKVRLSGTIPRQYMEELSPAVFPGSRMLAIGGVTAQVTAKRGVAINLEEDKRNSTPTEIALAGAIVPGLANQRIEVDLYDPKGRRRLEVVRTDGQGNYQALFDLTRPPSLEDELDPHGREELVQGDYKAQAFVYASPDAAEAESNKVHIIR